MATSQLGFNPITGGVEVQVDGTAVATFKTAGNGMGIPAAVASNEAVRLDQFVQSKAANGYQKLPSGLIIQWGSATSSGTASGNVAITFPIAFATSAYQLTATIASGAQANYIVLCGAMTTTGATMTTSLNGAGATGITVQYIAIGL